MIDQGDESLAFGRRTFLKGAGGTLLALSPLGLVACGGGGSGSSAPSAGEFPTASVSFDIGKTGVVSAADRANALTTLGNLWVSLTGKPPSAIAGSMVAAMKKIAVVGRAGTTSDGGCWLEFIDGQIVGYDLSFYTPKPSAAPRTQAPPPVSRPSASVEKPFTGILTSNTAYVMQVIPAVSLSTAANYLSNRGFAVQATSGSLADWTAMANAGLVINASHGLLFNDKKLNITRFMQQVSDASTPALDIQYADLLSVGQLARIAVPGVDSNLNPVTNYFYALTSTWPGFTGSTFAPQCLYLNESCLGFRLDDFSVALFALGVGGYLGWTYPVQAGDAGDTVAMFLDRALGFDEFAPAPTSKEPPPPWQTAASLLATLARPDEGYDFATSVNPATNGKTHFHYQANSDGLLKTLIPSIASGALSADGTTYTLTGDFGTTEGTAMIGTTAAKVLSWSATSVALSVSSAQSGGDVVLTVDYLTSNPSPFYGMSISPTQVSMAPGNSQTFTVTPPAGITEAIEYVWTQTTADGTFSTTAGSGNTITTSLTSVDLVTTPSDTGTATVAVVAYVTIGGVKTVVGKAQAVVTFSTAKGITFQIPNLQQGETGTITATLENVPATGFYEWNAHYGTVNGQAPIFNQFNQNTVYVKTSILSIQYTFPVSQYLLYDTLTLQVNDASGAGIFSAGSQDII